MPNFLHRRQRKSLLYFGVPLLFLLLLLLVVAAVCFHYRHELRLQKLHDLSPEAILEKVNPMTKPNMARLEIIVEDQLRMDYSKVLGSGAFGVVYKVGKF